MIEIFALVVCWYVASDPTLDRCKLIENYQTPDACMRQAGRMPPNHTMNGAYKITVAFGCLKRDEAVWRPL